LIIVGKKGVSEAVLATDRAEHGTKQQYNGKILCWHRLAVTQGKLLCWNVLHNIPLFKFVQKSEYKFYANCFNQWVSP